jgi:hypothetical protein
MKLKIVSDGTIFGTKVLTEDGKPLEYVRSISIFASVDQPPTATVELTQIPVEMTVELNET